jgi:hypothetical protein
MAYKRYKSEIALPKEEKISLMAEYINYYENLINVHGTDVLNIKIPRGVFSEILDNIGTLVNEQAMKMANEEGAVKDFLQANPLPPHMQKLLPDEFRVFALLINSLKQWVSAESAATDKFLLGGTARQTCRSAVDKCIVTGEELGESSELHHPMRDGRPPILLSKKGHDFIEQNNLLSSTKNVIDDDTWSSIKQIKKKMNQSWIQLREGCNAISTGSSNYRSGAKSFANKVIKETGATALEIIEMLDNRNLGAPKN